MRGDTAVRAPGGDPRMKVRLFAALRELAGSSELDADAPDVGTLLADLSERFGPRFDRIMEVGTVIVDGEPAGRERTLGPDDEVALLPPVSGGSWPNDRTIRYITPRPSLREGDG